MENNEQDVLNVDVLWAEWTEKQQHFELDIRMLLDKSKYLAKQLEAPEEPDDKLERQKNKLDELMVHLTEELKVREAQSNAKKRLQEWITNLDKLRATLATISRCLLNVGLVEEVSISKLCNSQEYSQHNFELLTDKLKYCEELRSKHLQKLISYTFNEVNIWCKNTLMEPPKDIYQQETQTVEMLESLEQKLDDLKEYYNRNKSIYETYAKRMDLWLRMEILDEQAKEPSRFHNRGGQLLREEKERNLIRTKLPQVEAQLAQLVEEYEQRTNQVFLIYGEEILSRISADWTEYRSKQIGKDPQPSTRRVPHVLRKTYSVPHFNQNSNTSHPMLNRHPDNQKEQKK